MSAGSAIFWPGEETTVCASVDWLTLRAEDSRPSRIRGGDLAAFAQSLGASIDACQPGRSGLHAPLQPERDFYLDLNVAGDLQHWLAYVTGTPACRSYEHSCGVRMVRLGDDILLNCNEYRARLTPGEALDVAADIERALGLESLLRPSAQGLVIETVRPQGVGYGAAVTFPRRGAMPGNNARMGRSHLARFGIELVSLATSSATN